MIDSKEFQKQFGKWRVPVQYSSWLLIIRFLLWSNILEKAQKNALFLILWNYYFAIFLVYVRKM